jgi:type I restriction enzyme, S subunit
MEVKPRYKQTEVGMIPEDWEVQSLSSFASVASGKRLPLGRSLTDQETPYPYIRVTDMHQGTVSLADIKFVPVDVFPAIKRYRIFKEDIFISVAGTLGIIGKIPAELDGANLTENADRITNIKCSQDYLLYIMRSRLIQKQIDSLQTLGAQPKLALTRIREFAIPLPSTLAEQEAIAEVLSDTDSLIESQEQLITKKRQIKQGAMQELLTGKRRLPGFSGEWKEKILKNTATLKARIGWQGLTTTEYLNSGEYYLVTGTDFKAGYIDWDNCHYVDESRYRQDTNIQLNENDVLVTKDGTIGKVAFINHLPKPATLNSGVFVIRPIEGSFHPEFFYYLLCSNIFTEFLNQLSAGSTINHLYQKDFVSFVYSLPEAIDEQEAIAEVLSNMNDEICKLEAKLVKTRQLKQGMIQELLTGRIRLI